MHETTFEICLFTEIFENHALIILSRSHWKCTKYVAAPKFYKT